MREQIGWLVVCLLVASLAYAVVYALVTSWRRMRYGCSRCYYMRRGRTRYAGQRTCTAACWNQFGKTCQALHDRYQSEDEEDA